MKKRITVAVDGLSACGKSSFAKQIAKALGYTYIDTGAMYRAVALAMLRLGLDRPEELTESTMYLVLAGIEVGFRMQPDGYAEITLGGEGVESEIRSEAVSALVSRVAALPAVRDKMVALQREIGKDGGVVMDGRDIGQVVFPNAELKIFMTADIDVRAQRRYDQLKAKGQEVSIVSVRENLASRDALDQSRAYNPMRRADDAVLLDNSRMTPAEQLQWVQPLLRERIEGGTINVEG